MTDTAGYFTSATSFEANVINEPMLIELKFSLPPSFNAALVIPAFPAMATIDTAASAGNGIVVQAGIQRFPWVAFKSGGGQIAEVFVSQQGWIVADRTAHVHATGVSSMFAGGCGVVLA